MQVRSTRSVAVYEMTEYENQRPRVEGDKSPPNKSVKTDWLVEGKQGRVISFHQTSHVTVLTGLGTD